MFEMSADNCNETSDRLPAAHEPGNRRRLSGTDGGTLYDRYGALQPVILGADSGLEASGLGSSITDLQFGASIFVT